MRTTTIAVIVIVVAATGAIVSQEPRPFENKPVFKLADANDPAKGGDVQGAGEIPLREALHLWARMVDKRLDFVDTIPESARFRYFAPQKGRTQSPRILGIALAYALEQRNFCLCAAKESIRIEPIAMAPERAQHVAPEDVEALDPWLWANVDLALNNVDVTHASSLLFASGMRHVTGNPTGGSIEMTGRADRLAKAVHIARTADEAARREQRPVAIPAGIDGVKFEAALAELFSNERVNIKQQDGELRVTASPLVHSEIESLLAKLKE